MKNQNDYIVSIIAAIVAALSMGTIGLIARLSGLEAQTITFFRLFLGGAFLLLFALPFCRKAQFIKMPSIRTIASGVLLASFILSYIQSIQSGSLIISVMTLYLAPVLATLLSQKLHKEAISRSSYISVVGVLTGFFMVLNIFSNSIAFDLLSFSYSLIAMVCYAGFILVNKKEDNRQPILISSSMQLLIGALVILPFVSFDHVLNLTSQQWGWVIATGFVPGFLGLACAIYAIQKLSTVTYATISYIEPISTLIFAWFIFNEPLNLIQLTGCILIIFFSLYQVYNEKKQNTPLAVM